MKSYFITLSTLLLLLSFSMFSYEAKAAAFRYVAFAPPTVSNVLKSKAQGFARAEQAKLQYGVAAISSGQVRGFMVGSLTNKKGTLTLHHVDADHAQFGGMLEHVKDIEVGGKAGKIKKVRVIFNETTLLQDGLAQLGKVRERFGLLVGTRKAPVERAAKQLDVKGSAFYRRHGFRLSNTENNPNKMVYTFGDEASGGAAASTGGATSEASAGYLVKTRAYTPSRGRKDVGHPDEYVAFPNRQ